MGWLETSISGVPTPWANRIKISVDGSKIEGDLTNFPIFIKVGTGAGTTDRDTSVVSATLASVPGYKSKSLAITSSDGTTQQYVEIEKWDATTSGIWMWTKVPALSSGTDTNLYLYYDDSMPENTTYVGDVGDVPAMAVWDSNFKLVCHLDSTLTDSTNNNNDGTNSGADDVTGIVADAKSFPDTADKITFSTNNYGSSNTYTVETIVYPTSETGVHLWESDNALGAPSMEGSSTTLNYWTNNATSISTGNLGTTAYRYLAAKYDKTQTSKALIVDASVMGTESTNVSDTFGSSFYLGNRGKSGGFGVDARNYGGTVDELRVSVVARSDAWLKATYYSNFDNLLSYSAPLAAPTFKFDGYVQVLGSPAARKVGLFRRSTMELVDSNTSSSSTGYFELYSPHSDYHFVVILPDIDDDYNLLSYDKINPEN